jgi:elongation factor 1-alpha
MTIDCRSDIEKFLLDDIEEVKNDYEIEYDYGNKEYKLKLCDVREERLEGLVTQMKFRLEEGGGECFYEIGVEDNGNPLGLTKEELETSVCTLKKVVEKLDATATVTKLHKGKKGLIAEVMIKRREEVYKDKLEIKIGLMGEEGSGKSTLVFIH